MAQKVWHVLDQEKARLVTLQYPNDIFEQIAPLRAVKSTLVASLREGLARESGAENVVSRDLLILGTDVAKWLNFEVLVIEFGEVGIDLACEYAAMAKLRQCLMKTSQTSK